MGENKEGRIERETLPAGKKAASKYRHPALVAQPGSPDAGKHQE